MRIGSMFAGIGGLDLACEWAFQAVTTWQLDLVASGVRRRHWPDALQVEGDVTRKDPSTLPPVDIICGGFSCKGVSVAGDQRLLEHPETRATYYGMLRFVEVIRPRYVVFENTPLMLTRLRPTMEEHYTALGYGLTW